MFTVKRLPVPSFVAAAHSRDVHDIMRQELALVGSVGDDPSGDFDILITGPHSFEVSEDVPPDAVDAAVKKIFDRYMRQESAKALSDPDKKDDKK